jgi:hypothetical protein
MNAGWMSAWGECGEFNFDDPQWTLLLSLVNAFGWRPEGTRAPEDVAPNEWQGVYAPGDGQELTRDDALALADALDRALDDIPDLAVERGPTLGMRANSVHRHSQAGSGCCASSSRIAASAVPFCSARIRAQRHICPSCPERKSHGQDSALSWLRALRRT